LHAESTIAGVHDIRDRVWQTAACRRELGGQFGGSSFYDDGYRSFGSRRSARFSDAICRNRHRPLPFTFGSKQLGKEGPHEISEQDPCGRRRWCKHPAFSAVSASAEIACNGDVCWHVKDRYEYPPTAKIIIHPDDWKWEPSEHYSWREHEGRGYWRGDRWTEW
jgi:hypothetical protein